MNKLYPALLSAALAVNIGSCDSSSSRKAAKSMENEPDPARGDDFCKYDIRELQEGVYAGRIRNKESAYPLYVMYNVDAARGCYVSLPPGGSGRIVWDKSCDNQADAEFVSGGWYCNERCLTAMGEDHANSLNEQLKDAQQLACPKNKIAGNWNNKWNDPWKIDEWKRYHDCVLKFFPTGESTESPRPNWEEFRKCYSKN